MRRQHQVGDLLAIFVAECPESLSATLAAFKSGRLCSSLQPPEGVF
jgi:acyl-coenzyme A synthetase/AMP-(fatty) acid ligase